MIENARLRKAALFCLFLLAGGVLSACMKFELQYDFLQYHYYNGFAFWNNRLGVDIAPAFIPTFYNPLLDAVMYALMSVLKQHVTIYCFIQGLWFGALMYLAFKISALYFDLTTRSGKVFACISLLICATGTATWFQMGTATHETELAVLTVGAFYLLLRDKKRFFAAGLLLGMAAGFKLTAAIYCISTGLTLILFYKTLDKPLKSISVFALGGLIGFLIVDGFWMVKLWNLYGNPFFPFWNGIFKSPYFPEHNYIDTLHLGGKTFWDRLFAPFLMAYQNGFSVNMLSFDPRFAVAVVVGALSFVAYRKHINKKVLFAGIYALVCFIVWEILSFNARFLMPAEIVVGILLTYALYVFWKKHPELNVKTAFFYALATIVLYAFLAVPFITEPWGRRKNLDVIGEKIILPPDSVLLLKGEFSQFVAADILKDNPSVRAIAYGLHQVITDWNVNRYGKMDELATNVMRGKKKYILMDKFLWLGNDDVTFEAYSWNCRHMKVGDIGLFDGKRFYFFCDKDNEQ